MQSGADEYVSKPFDPPIMKYLFENRGIIISRKALLDGVWGFDYIGEERNFHTVAKELYQISIRETSDEIKCSFLFGSKRFYD